MAGDRPEWTPFDGGFDYMRGDTRLASVKSWGGWRTERGDEGFSKDVETAKIEAAATVAAFEIAPERCGPPRKLRLS